MSNTDIEQNVSIIKMYFTLSFKFYIIDEFSIVLFIFLSHYKQFRP